MALRLGLAILVGVIIVAGIVAGYAYYKNMSQSQYGTSTSAVQVETSKHEADKTSVPASAQPSSSPASSATSAGHGPKMHANASENNLFREETSCNSVASNGKTIGQNIKWLFDNHNVFHYVLRIYPENKTIIWIITAPSKQYLETLVSHIMQMECVVKNGGNPRPFDPVFQVDSVISAKYVHTEIKWINDTAIKVIKTADNECAFEVIKLHADIVKGFFDTGRIEAKKIHEVPEDVQEICKPYLEETSP